jgi:hypothetical protein
MQLEAAPSSAGAALLVLATCGRALVLVAGLWAAVQCWTGGLGVALFDAITDATAWVPAMDDPRDGSGSQPFADAPWGDDADEADDQVWRTDKMIVGVQESK